MTNEDFLRHWLDLVWIKKDFRSGEAAFSTSTQTSSVAGKLTMQPNDYETMVGALCYNFEPEKCTLDHVVSTGPDISAVLNVHGRRIDTNDAACLTVFIYRRIEGEKFTASYSSADYLSFFEAVGQLPPDTIETLMMGGHFQQASY